MSLSDSAYRLARETEREIRRLRRKFWWQRNRDYVVGTALYLALTAVACAVVWRLL